MPNTQKPRVLVVEPDDDCRDVLASLLELYGFSVVTARTGAEALEHVHAALPHAALLELVSDMEGFTLAKQLRALPGADAMVIAAVTGYTEPELQQQAVEAGCDHFIVKPVVSFAFLDVLAKTRTSLGHSAFGGTPAP